VKFEAMSVQRNTTTKVMTPLGVLYVTICRDNDGVMQLLTAQCGKEKTGGTWCGAEGDERLSHPQINSLLDCVCHLARKLVKAGVPERIVAAKLMGYDEGWPVTFTFPKGAHGDAHRVRSLQDAIAKVMVHDAEARKSGRKA
jgi:hypothetical protein